MAAVLDIKTPADRNKLIAAVVLGVLALGALYFAFGRSIFGSSSTTVKVTTSPTPKASTAAPSTSATSPVSMPSQTEQDFTYQTTQVDYRPGNSYAPDPGRNIFSFYEPPPPCPTCPTPVKPTPTPAPVPTPTPFPVQLAFVNPQSVYAGTPRGFRLEANGDKFTPDMHIYINQVQMPTTFVSDKKLVTEIPANIVAGAGVAQVIVQNKDGTLYSNAVNFNVQPPPTPGVTYIGMISRARHNNDTAYLTQQGQPDKPFGVRLNDVVQGRFRVIDISAAEVVFQDTELGFKHRVQLNRVAQGGSPSGFPQNNPQNGTFQQFVPGVTGPCVPGIPCSPQQRPTPDPNKKDVDDNDDGPPE
ncbi:MAG: IPT/TIG domain-containing protein [Pyrinomonadaceae bacterium]